MKYDREHISVMRFNSAARCEHCSSGRRTYQNANTGALTVSTHVHQEVLFQANPKCIYDALTDGNQFSKVSGGAPAEMPREAGGVFACFGGMITGRIIELVPNQRIVQAWRAGNWPAGIYSIVKFELSEQGGGTRLVLDQTGFPEGGKEHLEAGWKSNYWEPLKRFLDQAH